MSTFFVMLIGASALSSCDLEPAFCVAASARHSQATNQSKNIYQFVDYRAPVHHRAAACQGGSNSSHRRRRQKCDTACQTEPALALSLLVDHVAQSTQHEAGSQDPKNHAMHAILAFARSRTCKPEWPMYGTTEASQAAGQSSAMHSDAAPVNATAEESLNICDRLASKQEGNRCGEEAHRAVRSSPPLTCTLPDLMT
jgi:hypothetical protein